MEGNSIKSFENLCRIFEMRIKLDRKKGEDTPSDILDNYNKYVRKIDNIYNDEFSDEVKSLISPRDTLEEERKRLEKLIFILENRLEKRRELEARYYDATLEYIMDLQPIVSDAELVEKKDRLELITKYLDASNEMDNIDTDLDKLKEELSTAEDKKEEYETKNSTMEDELYTSFKSIINNLDYYRDIDEDTIDKKLEETSNKTTEAKETFEVTRDSVGSLLSSGSNEDYSSYIDDAEKVYLSWKNKEIILKIYILVMKLEDAFSDIYIKREKINALLEDRKSIREKLGVDSIDVLLDFEKVMLEQINVLNTEKEVLDNITNYTNRIKYKEERRKELEEVSNSTSILSILREYGLANTYEVPPVYDEVVEEKEPIDIPQVDDKKEADDIPVIKEINPYRIVLIKDYPRTLNIGLAKLKGESIREKVNKKLNPKNAIKGPLDVIFTPPVSKVEEPPKEDKEEDIPTWVIPSSTLDTSNNIENNKKEKGVSTEINDSDTESPTPNLSNVLPSTSYDEFINSFNLNNNSNNDNVDTRSSPNVMNSFNIPNGNTNIPDPVVPTWDEIKPKLDNYDNDINDSTVIPSLNNNINSANSPNTVSAPSSNDNNGMFWVPVGDSSDSFPDMNIPIQNSNTNNGFNSFGFPDIN